MRYTTIDSFRGFAVAGMILFHANYLLENVFARDIIPFGDGFWYLLWPTVAALFISLAWVVSVLSTTGKSLMKIWHKTLKRTLILILCAGVISIVTYFFIPEQAISWGILHFLALASILGMLSLRGGYMNFIFGIFFLIIPYTALPIFHSWFLIPVGFPPLDYTSADYYPLIPWMGYYLIGQGIGHICTKDNLLPSLDVYTSRSSLFLWLGRHALVVYMVHVPILYGVIWVACEWAQWIANA